MALLQLVHAPNPIFKKKAERIDIIDDEIVQIANSMLETVYFEKAVGMGANMVGILKRIAVVDLQLKGVREPRIYINPEITWSSEEQVSLEEGSISFRGISAMVLRPKAIKMKYQDCDGKECELEADGSLARVIQHEVDYLNGITFLDHLSKLKRDILIDKMIKYYKLIPPHIHSSSCKH